jgi:hypothetical protein
MPVTHEVMTSLSPVMCPFTLFLLLRTALSPSVFAQQPQKAFFARSKRHRPTAQKVSLFLYFLFPFQSMHVETRVLCFSYGNIHRRFAGQFDTPIIGLISGLCTVVHGIYLVVSVVW